MQKRKELESVLGFHLIHVEVLDKKNTVIRTSYEVVDPADDVIGRFVSLKDAQNFIKLLSNLTQEQNEEKELPIQVKQTENNAKVQAAATKRKSRFTFKFK
ncbi:hypothetical protein [Colwellia sp. E2M01]|uniref:hypothetical protein n=1 Tax=Colwellia sp. E2M01 TaxID=2841561 RepID=UPI001C09DA95|nr:hypothetical protein [Colwellia sp. E2M01]MBU2872014.1 hypothetical protein [Colwellia sp. E2M01]